MLCGINHNLPLNIMWRQPNANRNTVVLKILAVIQISDACQNFTRIAADSTLGLLCLYNNHQFMLAKMNFETKLLVFSDPNILPGEPVAGMSLAIDSQGTVYVGKGVHVFKITKDVNTVDALQFFTPRDDGKIGDNLAQSATATTVLIIVADGLHVEVLQKGLLRCLIHGLAIVCYLNPLKDLLIAGSNYEMTALETV